MSLPPGFLDDLRSRVSLAQVIARKVAWDPRKTRAARGDYWAPCPFHQERTASFHVDDAKGFYHCFGCHAKGDAITFLRETENLGFIEAVELLAREAGMPMPEADPAAAARAAASQGLVEAMEAAVRFYRLQLNTAGAAAARGYLDGRGLTAQALERFEIGYAPDRRTAMLDHLRAKGFAPDRLAEAGLIGLPGDGGAYDRFRNRIMFPIRDARGRAIAFGARAIGDAQPKYLNSPETPLFDKGRSLYNIGPARAAAGRTGALVVAEGYMDVIALAEAGFEHAVAPLGTAITEAQLAALWKLAPEPVLALDGDQAGVEAAHRLIALALPLLTPGHALRFALLPPKMDPDDVIRDGGAPALQALLDASRPMAELIWTRETEGQVLDSPERRAALDARLRAHLQRIADPSVRAYYKAEFGARCSALFAAPARRGPGRTGASQRPGAVAPAAATRATALGRPGPGAGAGARIRESAILAGCLNHPELADAFEDRLGRAPFHCTDLAAVRGALIAALGGDPAMPLAARVAARLGRDPLPELMAPGQVAANRHLRPGGDPDLAARAIAEELGKLEADADRLAEIRDAERELPGPADEGLTWRLREVAEAAHRAVSAPFAATADAEVAAEAALSAELQALTDPEIWKRPKNR